MSPPPRAGVTGPSRDGHVEVDETASTYVCRDVPQMAPDVTAGRARALLIGRRYESAADIAVCEGDRLLGLVSIEVALSAPNWSRLGELMDPDPPIVAPGTDQEIAAWKAVDHGETSLAVVDAEDRFVGLVPPRRLLAVLLTEHDEDLARLSGFAATTRSARHASEEPVGMRLAHRLPWLLVGLSGSLLAAGIVGRFERALEATVAIAFFVPGIVYMADAVGTQTEALVIRGLSVGVPIRRVVRNELLTGLLVGVAIASVFFPLGLILWGDGDLALCVAIALLAACSTATIVAMVLPWAFHRAGADPAFGSGPLATVVQDLLTLVIYFTVASAIVS